MISSERNFSIRAVTVTSRRGPGSSPVVESVELQVASAFSFLRGASRPEELVEAAALMGHRRLALTDRNGLYGVVQAYRAGQEHGVEIIPGAELALAGTQDDTTLILLPRSRRGYGNLCRLLTLGRRRVGKGDFHLTLDDVAERSDGLHAIHVGAADPFRVSWEREIFGDRLALGFSRKLLPSDRADIEATEAVAARYGLPLVALGGVLMHAPERKPMQDILTCIRLGLRLDEAGRRLLPNGAALLRSPEDRATLFVDHPEALEESRRIADLCTFRL
ncbi:MAG: PHP domain-containing protein, partial [Myxococcota bacterium]